MAHDGRRATQQSSGVPGPHPPRWRSHPAHLLSSRQPFFHGIGINVPPPGFVQSNLADGNSPQMKGLVQLHPVVGVRLEFVLGMKWEETNVVRVGVVVFLFVEGRAQEVPLPTKLKLNHPWHIVKFTVGNRDCIHHAASADVFPGIATRSPQCFGNGPRGPSGLPQTTAAWKPVKRSETRGLTPSLRGSRPVFSERSQNPARSTTRPSALRQSSWKIAFGMV